MKNITDIFFDLDHTLWDFDKNSKFAFDTIFRKRQIAIETEKFVEVYAPINQTFWKLYQVDEITHEELRYMRLRQSFDALEYPISDETINQISQDYIEHLTDNNELFDGVIEILDYLKPNYNLHIITNGLAEVQFRKLSNSGISDYFKTVTHSEMAGVKKPHKDIFEYAVSLAKTRKENALMIGDCLEADVKGAMEYGMQAVYFNEAGDVFPEGIPTIRHLSELKNIL